jgi:hypothetical protein
VHIFHLYLFISNVYCENVSFTYAALNSWNLDD